jgi:Tat protein secretion system quality control protein TatD with DNase activity
MVHTAQVVADLKQVSLEELCKVTKKNALAMFPKLEWIV